MLRKGKMKITFTKINQEDESTDFSLQLSNPELNFLITFALESLVQIGAVQVNMQSREEQEVILPLDSFVPPMSTEQVN